VVSLKSLTFVNYCIAGCSTYFTLGPVPPSYLALSWIIILLNVGMMVTFLYQLLRAVRTTVLLKVGMSKKPYRT
jgi:hypothetical protein